MSTVETASTVSHPPSYSEPHPIRNDADDGNQSSVHQTHELPSYSPPIRSSPITRNVAVRPPEPKEFQYQLDKKGKTAVTLTIIADGSYSKQVPTYVEGQTVKGRVRLSLDKPDTIQSVIISIRGQLIIGANPTENVTFLNISTVLWSQSDGEPLNASANNDQGIANSGSQSPKFSGKLLGNYTWPFFVGLPREVLIPSGTGPRSEPRVFSLPQTFNERHTRASVFYEASVQLTRGKLRPDHRITAPIGYIMITRPPPFPPLRLLAYQEGTPVLSPIIDPDGWFSPESIQVRGKLFNNRIAQVSCTLFLAKPLSYTKGSVIPLFLRLECADEQALDLLSSPKAITLRLRRRIKYHWNAEKTLESAGWNDAVDDSQLAVWWRFTEGEEQRAGKRYVNGEVYLRADTKPGLSIAQFRIEYSVVLFPFDAPGFSTGESQQPILEHPVEIVTAYAPGPRPRMSAPPGYEPDVPIVAQAASFSTAGVSFF